MVCEHGKIKEAGNCYSYALVPLRASHAHFQPLLTSLLAILTLSLLSQSLGVCTCVSVSLSMSVSMSLCLPLLYIYLYLALCLPLRLFIMSCTPFIHQLHPPALPLAPWNLHPVWRQPLPWTSLPRSPANILFFKEQNLALLVVCSNHQGFPLLEGDCCT